MLGATPEGEPRFFNAVTGRDLSFVDGMEIGRRIWNLDRAIWILQGRHRNMEKFSKYVYTKPVDRPHPLPVYEKGQWKFSDNLGRTLDPDRFEEWKSRYFRLEGWDVGSGWPTRATLEEMGLRKIADALEHHNRLGSPE
jgi:aldehyde:ferredoxin oxidoreductase